MILCVAAVIGCGTETVAPASPRALANKYEAPVLPSMPPSVVDAPVTYALEPLTIALEAAVPRRFGNLDKRITIGESRKQVAYEATRTPFTVGFEDGELVLATTIAYKARGWYRPIFGPTISASCGTNDMPPRMRMVLTSTLGITSDWELETKTRVSSLRPFSKDDRDLCTVTFAQVDVTDQVVKAVRRVVSQQLPKVDRRVEKLDVKRRVSGWYTKLQRNIRVTDSLWLQLLPGDVALGEISMRDSQLVASVRLQARPRLVTGPEPPLLIRPLPALSLATNTIGDSVHLNIEGLLAYADATVMLEKQLIGKSFSRLGRSVRVERVRFYPLEDGRIVLAATMGGSVRGDVYLVGTPQVDREARALTVPDLDFDVETNDALISGVTWLKREEFVQRLRQSARFPLDDVLERTRLKVEEALNRDLTDGVRLSGAVRTGRLVDVLVHPRWLVVRAEAAGALALDVDRPIKRSPPKKP